MMNEAMELLRRPLPVPDGTSGDWGVDTFTISKEEARRYNTCLVFSFSAHRAVEAGTYRRLYRGRPQNVIMSTTPAELRDHLEPVERARGDCLINGLGLGVVVNAILAKTCVTSVTVVEREPDVIALVAPYLDDRRLTVVEADAFEWQPPRGKRYQMVWHDVWDDLCTDNLDDMATLHRRYGRRTDWQGSWARDDCLHYRRLGR